MTANQQNTNPAGWDCDNCRKHGLEFKRRCGFLPAEKRGEPHVVWGRKQVRADECPKSFVTGESFALLEEFFVRRRLGIHDLSGYSARQVDGFLILRDEMEREERDGTAQY